MSNNKQSSIEWLEQELKKIPFVNVLEVFEQAKAMHKSEILYAIEWGNRKGYDEHKLTCIYDEDEQYYKEVFGGNNG